MKIEGKAKALAIYVGESDHWHGKPLYAAIVERARELGLAGATVTRGIMGFGANSRIHTTAILRLSEDLPVVVQIVDEPTRLDGFLKELDDMVTEGMVVTWEVNVEKYRASKG
jgi:PII-like signaling protein